MLDEKSDILGPNQVYPEAKKWSETTKIHPGWLLNYKHFVANEDPIETQGLINTGSLVMLLKAKNFLNSFRWRFHKQLTSFLRHGLTGYEIWEEEHLNRPCPQTQQIINGVSNTSSSVSEYTAVISEYILKNFPDDSSIVQDDNARKNPNNWLSFCLRKGTADDYFAYADGDYHYILDPEDFNPGSMDVTAEEFEFFQTELSKSIIRINHAVESACLLINYINAVAYIREFNEYATEGEEPWHLEKAPKGGASVLNRFNEAIYRKRKFELPFKIPDVEHDNTDWSLQDTPYLDWIQRHCPQITEEVRSAFLFFQGSKDSLKYESEELKELTEISNVLVAYEESIRGVKDWYYKRYLVPNDQTARKDFKFIILHFKKFTWRVDYSAFIADQKLVKDFKERNEPLPVKTNFKDGLDAIEKLGPMLTDLGLKIVPLEYQDHTQKLQSEFEKISQNLSNISNLKIPNLGQLEKIWKKRTLPSLTEIPVKYDFTSPVVLKTKGPKIKAKGLKESSNAEYVGKAESNKDKEKPAGEFDSEVFLKEKIREWTSDDEPKKKAEYESYLKRLPFGQCTYADIGAAKANKTIRYGGPRNKEQITRDSAANKGRDFVERVNKKREENGEPLVNPIKGGYKCDREQACVLTFQAAFREVKNAKGFTKELTEASNNLKKDKKFSEDTDKTFKKHLRKIGVKAEYYKKWIGEVDKHDGRIKGKTNAVFNSIEIAICFCEGPDTY